MSAPLFLGVGPSHEVAPDEMFFSTTDARGVIKQANTVFVRLSRYSREQLVGAPHSIIRHPSMPGGAFLLMWDTLQARRPFCAYVDNLAADGSRYTVFATITPLGDDYLSVRVRPRRTDLLDAARGLYRLVRPLELQRRHDGASAHGAAVDGRGHLASLLADAGFPSYEEFIWTALPAEVEERAASGTGFPARPGAVGPAAELLAASAFVHGDLSAWTAEMADLQALADALVAAGGRLGDSLAESERTVGEFTAAAAAVTGFAPILGGISLWTQMMGEIHGGLQLLGARLAELRASVAQTRFRIALSALQSETVGQFACELIDEVPGSDLARPAIGQLVRALHEGIADADAAMRANAALAATASDELVELADLVGVPTGLLRMWESLASGRDEDAVTRLLPRVGEAIAHAEADAEALRVLAARCRAVRPVDIAHLDADLDRIHVLAEAA